MSVLYRLFILIYYTWKW